MALEVNSLNSCCAISEIKGIEYFTDPKIMLLDIYSAMTISTGVVRNGTYRVERTFKPGAFYLFSGVERLRSNTKKCYCEDDDCENSIELGYASALARYIKTEKLGTIKASSGQFNRRNEPNHLVKVFIWTPHVDNLKAWYLKHGKGVKV